MRASDHRRVLNFLGAIALSMTDKINRNIEQRTGLAHAHAAALIQIGMSPGENMVHLRRMTGLSQPNTSRVVDALVRRGLVARGRAANGDLRSAALDLTAAGVRTMTAAIGARYEALERAIAGLGPADRDRFEALLEKIVPHVSDDLDDTHIICRLCDFDGCPLDECPAELLYTGKTACS